MTLRTGLADAPVLGAPLDRARDFLQVGEIARFSLASVADSAPGNVGRVPTADAVEVFPFRFAAAYRLAALPFGVWPHRARVIVGADELEARFGPWRLRTPLENLVAVSVTGPYGLLRTAGPARLAFTDRGLTFATNGDAGVRLRFHRPVAGIEPSGVLRHPELTVTVADVEGFARLLRERTGISRAV